MHATTVARDRLERLGDGVSGRWPVFNRQTAGHESRA
jgi:hypothetical protein